MGYPYQFLDAFRRHNAERAELCFDHPTDEVWWTNAIAGEAGEACNFSKKLSRGDCKSLENEREMRHKIALELADVITYCDLLLNKLGYKMDDILLEKFNIVSERVGYPKILI